MIPFLKKNKDGKKPPKSTVPRTAQESIPFQRMFEDGTCRVRPGYYTRTIQYQDINYQLAQQEDKTAIFEEWCSFLNFFDSSIHFELSFVNTATDSADFEKSIRIPYQQDGFDDVRAEYSQMLRQQLSKGNNGLTKRKYLTFGVSGESMQQVKARLDHIQNDLLNNFHRLGVQAKSLDGRERLKLMHGIFNLDGESKFYFDWKKLAAGGLTVKDAIDAQRQLFNEREVAAAMLCETTTAFARAIAAKAAELPIEFFKLMPRGASRKVAGVVRNYMNVDAATENHVMQLEEPYHFKGQTYTEVDLNGIADLNSMNESEAENRLARAGFMVTETSFNYLFACILASMATGLPEEFFTGLPLREVLKLKNAVNDSGFFE